MLLLRREEVQVEGGGGQLHNSNEAALTTRYDRGATAAVMVHGWELGLSSSVMISDTEIDGQTDK